VSRYVLTRQAREDLFEIQDYIAQDSPAAADRVLGEIRKSASRLAERPGIGRLREDLADEPLRVWPVYSYLVIYRPQTRPLQIIRIVSGYRDLFALDFPL
jgi:plasmid stabilization system protein ParE